MLFVRFGGARIVTPAFAAALFWAALFAACSDASSDPDAPPTLDAAPDTFVPEAMPPDGGSQDATPDVRELGCAPFVDTLPQDLFCTGLYTTHDPAAIAPTARFFVPGLVFWSDGAEKKRYVQFPPDTKIDTHEFDQWKFPVGTKVWKEFTVQGRRVETRIFWKRREDDWTQGTYLWSPDGHDATLNNEGVRDAGGGYEVPATSLCNNCHGGAADKLLGFDALSLGLETASGVTLATLVAEGRLSHPPNKTLVTLPEDGTGKAAKALGWLHMNCGASCHSVRGLAGGTQLRMRLGASLFFGADAGTVQATDVFQTAVGKPNNSGGRIGTAFHSGSDLRIAPGDHEHSLVWEAAHSRGEAQMPPIVTHVVDENGTQFVADWIDALPH